MRAYGLHGFVLILACLVAQSAAGDDLDWADTFYQYRVPVTLEADAAGWTMVPLTPAKITSAINQLETLQFDPQWFAANHVKVVEIDDTGHPIRSVASAGFYLIPDGPELVHNGEFEALIGRRFTDWTDRSGKEVFYSGAESPDGSGALEIKTCGGRDSFLSNSFDVELGAFYLLGYRARVDTLGGCPSFRLISARAHTRGLAEDSDQFPISHLPGLWARQWTKYEQVMKPYFYWNEGGAIRISGPLTGSAQVDDVSFQKMRLACLAELDRSGRHRWHVYYQPLNGVNLTVPQRRHSEVPSSTARIIDIDRANKNLGRTQYRLLTNDTMDVWFAETTVKLAPRALIPQATSDAVQIACARNEKQSFQLVIRPQKTILLSGIEVTALRNAQGSLPPSHIDIRSLEYVPILRQSKSTPTNYSGRLADPMVAIESKTLGPAEGSVAYWFTVKVPAGTSAGLYRGEILIRSEARTIAQFPLELEVYGFELPAVSPFRSSMGGGHITKITGDQKTIADYHGISSKPQIKKLAHAYYDEMASNKFTPHSAVQYSEIGMNWSPPPEGYNIEGPGNHFRLHDWDFTEFNRDLAHYIDDLKVNAFTLVHTNPSVITKFKHLPGDDRIDYDRKPAHVSLAWQTFRKATYVGYDKRKGDDYIEITKSQYDHLAIEFYRAIAKNLEQHGWLDYAYILVDETAYRGYEPYLDFIRLLKSDPLTARIQFAWCLQGPGAFTYKSDPQDSNYAFNNLLDIYMPETNENKHCWEKYCFSDYGVEPQRHKLWNYVTHTTRSSIDTPGINNRAMALEVFNNGGSGFLIWGTFIWDAERLACDNPWDDPGSYWGNGALSYFYPPSKFGPTTEPTWKIVPSLRIQTYREGVDDFEYAKILEDLVATARLRGEDVSEAEIVLKDIERFFPSTVHWSQNDTWYLDLRDRMARAIMALQ